VKGNYRGADGKIHTSPDGVHYSTLALWDTYRAAHPLYSLITPDKNVKFVNSLIRHYEQVGYLPVWAFWGRDARAMIGNHAVPVIADACLKGLPGIDHEKAFEAVKASLTTNHW
jgi:putative alpha-1,2-mannosidase